ncbi:MAG: glycine cleavage system protein GcvH [Bacillota bacterium]
MKWEVREGLLYTPKHEWIKQDGSEVTSGITDYAQDMLKDIVYVELPELGRVVKAGESVAVIESVKAVSDAYSPVDGVIKAVNELLLDQPELLNQDPYGAGWIVKVEIAAGYVNPDLMDMKAYITLLEREEES